MGDFLTGRTTLVTGGTGSFGNAMVRRMLDFGVREVRIFSRDEKKQEDMRHEFDDPRLRFYIGDVREYRGLDDALRSVDLVFHAAALKQVPSCEFYPGEAVRTNVLGTENLLAAAVANRVERVVVLSTDKAVYPINAMGISKAMMEKLAVAKSRMLTENDTTVCITRYGNVMASRGSVIPLFVRQIKMDQAITLTDPRMTRFMMSLPESVDLVLHAYEHGSQGDIFVQKAPSCTVAELADALQILFNTRVPIDIIGTRHGEKAHETLVSREEMARASEQGQYYTVPMDDRNLNYSKFITEGETTMTAFQDFTSENTKRLTQSELIELLSGLTYIQRELTSSKPMARPI
jgi:UDP-N-acetylglucosamine 4,6-dehydratase